MSYPLIKCATCGSAPSLTQLGLDVAKSCMGSAVACAKYKYGSDAATVRKHKPMAASVLETPLQMSLNLSILYTAGCSGPERSNSNAKRAERQAKIPSWLISGTGRGPLQSGSFS
jgi:hypothetical protein